MKRKFRLDWESVSIAAIYTAGWGMLLVASGRYWDDWAALDLSAKAAAEWSRQQGMFWQLDLLGLLSALPGTERIGHILTFVAFLVSALALHQLLRAVPTVSVRARVIIPALFAVFPVNGARFALVTLMYAISLAVFMVAWWLVASDFERPAWWRKVLAGGLLLFAMLSTGSLLVFSIVIPAYVVWARWAELKSAEGRKTLAMRYGFLLALPVVAWVVRGIALRPSGLYAGYNDLTLEGSLRAIGALPGAFRASIVDPVASSLSWAWVALLVAGAAYALMRWMLALEKREESPRRLAGLLGIGATLFVAGVFPYLAVGKMPQPAGWESRHQLLVPFGAAVLLYAAATLLLRILRLDSRVALLVLCVLLGAFIAADLKTSVVYQGDWYKQVSLMQRMAESSAIRTGSFFVFVDRAGGFNAPDGMIAYYEAGGKQRDVDSGRRVYGFYEYNGMMRRVFGDATRFGVNAQRLDTIEDPAQYREFEQYNFWQFQETGERVEVAVIPGGRDVRKPGVVFGLMWREMLAPAQFKNAVRDVVRIETRPLPPAEQ